MREHDEERCNRQRRRPRQRDVEDPDHEVRRANRPAKRLRLLTENPAQRNRTESGAEPARAVQDADAGRRTAGHGKDALAEDREQQQDTARQTPSSLHEYQGSHV